MEDYFVFPDIFYNFAPQNVLNMIDFNKLDELRKEWHGRFDELVKLIEDNNGCVIVDTPIFDYIKKEAGVRVQMRLYSMKIVTGLLIDKHIVLEYMDEASGELREVMVSRAFEAKSFGDIRYTSDCFKFILNVLKHKYNDNFSDSMGKVSETFKKGALVSTVKFNGEKLLGVFEHTYDNGVECCVLAADNKKFCVKLKSTKPADEEEQKIIQETIIKPRREAEKAKKKAQQDQETEVEEELTEEDLEEAVETPEETTEE
jgi:hypothetical protein